MRNSHNSRRSNNRQCSSAVCNVTTAPLHPPTHSHSSSNNKCSSYHNSNSSTCSNPGAACLGLEVPADTAAAAELADHRDAAAAADVKAPAPPSDAGAQ